MTQVKVLYQRTPMWRVGEERPPCTNADLAARLDEFAALRTDERYPGDYSGRMISVLPADREFSPGDLADPRRAVALVDNDEGLRPRRLKIVGKALADVTFEDRWGAVAPELAKKWEDPAIEEKNAVADVESAYEENKTRDADYERALTEWRETTAECYALGTVIDTPVPRHPGHVPEPTNYFETETVRIAALLPRTVTHSGVGLYEVGPGKTYSTIQSALDQLWADQGAATFTASQYVRIYAGTYDENVAPNSGLDPAYQYRLFIEGDPADDRDNIVLAPSGGTVAFYASGSTAYGTFRHLHVGGSPSNFSIQTVAVAYYWNLLDCYLGKPIFLLSLHRFEDCYLVGYARTSGGSILRCVFMGSGGAGTYALYGGGAKHVFVESCAFYNYDIMIPRYHYGTRRLYSNCTFVAATYGLYIAYAFPQFDDQTIINCIFKDVDYPVWWIQKLLWPEETTTQVGTPWVLRNNRVHGHTAFASDGSDSKTLTEFEALNRVDAAGNVEEDPLLTNPAGGDFSLQAASPCRGTGYGSGIVAYADGTAAHASHPNIGATGTAADPPAPIWSGGLSNLIATDAAVCGKIALTWDATGIGGAGLSIEYGVQRRIGAGAWTTVWIGSGTSVNICDNVAGQLYEFRVGARCADYEQAWVYPTDSDTATAATPLILTPPTILTWSVSGTTVTVTLAGVAGRTYRARLMDGAGGEDDEQGRTGSGDVALTAAGYGARYFTAWEFSNSIQSEPTGVYAVTVDDPSDADVAYYRVRTVTGLPSAPHKTAMLERIERPIQP